MLLSIQKASKPLVVFDLDSTLLCVRGRTKKILQKIASNDYIQMEPKIKQRFQDLNIHSSDFSLSHILTRNCIDLTAKEQQQVYHFWAKYFFSDQFLVYDQVYSWVRPFLEKLKNTFTSIRYLTGRNQLLMKKGTYQQIDRHKLPLEKKEHLIMKPNGYTEDAFFKKQELEKLHQEYSNIWFFENEPVIINFSYSYLPNIQYVFVHTAHSGRQKVFKNCLSIKVNE